MDKASRTNSNEGTLQRTAAERERDAEQQRNDERRANEGPASGPDVSNPPRTTTGRMTAPKFGSATSGGGELEPGPERD